MYFSKKRFVSLLLILCLFLSSFGCAVIKSKAHSEFEARYRNIETFGLIPPDIEIYELTAGGVRELKDEWSDMGKENVINALMKKLKEKEIKVESFIKDENMEEALALYRAVSICIELHTQGPWSFPEKQKNFDYSIGSIEKILKENDVDALMIIYGSDEDTTGGRQALIALGVLASIATGVVVAPRAGTTTMDVALVDPSGTILWYKNKSSGASHALKKPEDATSFVDDIFSDFPESDK